MKLWVLLVIASFTVPTASDTASDPKFPHRVLYVGNTQNKRAEEVSQFLKRHFDRVSVVDRVKFKPTDARDADVVLLDWSQSDSQLAKTPSPFGKIEEWSKPTVLLNSAGLLMAGQWQIIGGAG
jgi:hypothetical protein